MRALILAIQFLTRLPTPQVSNFTRDELSLTAPWFPAVGIVIGFFIAAAILTGAYIDPWLGALFGVITWTWITGALHLDGLADLVDALGAAHRDPQRLLQVMRDPHVGSFGVIALILQLLSKLVLLQLCIAHDKLLLFLIPLICAWSRTGALAWSAWLPALHTGNGETFAWKISTRTIIVNAIILMILSAAFLPTLLIAPCVLAIWWLFLRYRLGGMSGDCLGAGIELTETLLLLIAVCVPMKFNVWALI